MIKVKIQNKFLGRNEPTFRPLLFIIDKLKDYSIEITESNDYDFLFIGMADFINKKVSLQESIDTGLENLSKITGDYFLFDGSDSHSLMGAYEVFTQSQAIYLFKAQLHRDKENYNVPKAFNKWYFGEGSELDLAYDIPEDIWDRIKLTGWNFMSNVPDHRKLMNPPADKKIDICAIFNPGNDIPSFDHLVRNDLQYKKHRRGILDVLKKMESEYTIISGVWGWQEYMKLLYNSKISISPLGMGALRQGDGEAMKMGTAICKENLSMFDFGANPWKEFVTYIPFDIDCNNLEENLRMALSDYDLDAMVENFRIEFNKEYDDNKLCMRWYKIFDNLATVIAQ